MIAESDTTCNGLFHAVTRESIVSLVDFGVWETDMSTIGSLFPTVMEEPSSVQLAAVGLGANQKSGQGMSLQHLA